MKIIPYPLHLKKWIATPTLKKYVVWHGSFGRTQFTPFGKVDGKCTSTIDGWNQSEEKYGTPWVIDRDGTIYRTFDDREWIYHLGIPTTKGVYDKQSVGLTIANELYLDKSGQQYYSFGINSSTNQYFGPTFKKEWRGYNFWAAQTPEQIDATINLTLDVCQRHNITPVFYNSDKWNPRVWEIATIFTHANVKKEALDFTLEPWVIDKIKTAGITIIDS